MKDRDPKDSAIMYVEDSLNRLREHYIGIDIQSVDLCVTLLREYVDKLECREDIRYTMRLQQLKRSYCWTEVW